MAAEAGNSDLVTIYYAENLAAADVVKNRLEHAGIPAFVFPSRLPSSASDAAAQDASTVVVRVAGRQAQAAQRLLQTLPQSPTTLPTGESRMSDLPENNPDVAAAAGNGTPEAGGHEEPILVFDAASMEEAEVVRATLEAAGIPAVLLNPNATAGASTLGETVGDTWANGVFVAPSYVEAARAELNAPPPTEEELAAEEEADPTTLEEAEAAIKNA